MFSQWFSITNSVLFDPEFEPVMQSKPSNWSVVNFKKKKKTAELDESKLVTWYWSHGHTWRGRCTHVRRSYGRTVTKTKLPRTDGLPYFLTHGAMRVRLRRKTLRYK